MPEAGAIAAIWINVPAEHREEFRRWHNCEHSTDRLEGPGFRVCRRYNAAEGGAGHGVLCLFEGDTLDAFDSAYYLESRNRPSPWTRKCMAFIRDAERAVCRLEAACGAPPRYDAPYLYTVRLNAPEGPGAEEEMIAWYREEHLPRLCGVAGVLRARLFRRVEALSATETAEAEIQGTRAGGHGFLSYIEMETLAPLGTDAWKEAASGTPRSAAMIGRLRDLRRERWWLDFTKWKREG